MEQEEPESFSTEDLVRAIDKLSKYVIDISNDEHLRVLIIDVWKIAHYLENAQ